MITDFYGQTITVQPQLSVINSDGELTRTFPSSLNFTTKGRIEDHVTQAEYLVNERERYITSHRMYCPVITISNLDRVSLGTSTYEVKHIANRRSRFLAIDLALAPST